MTTTPSSSPTPAPTPAQLAAVLTAAADLLGARQDHMLGLDEWAALARAVGACHACKAADLLTERDLDDIAERAAMDWDEHADGELPSFDGEWRR